MKLFVKLLTAVAAIVCFSAPEANAFGTKPAKRIDAINAAYTNYAHAYTTNAPNVNDMLSKLNKVCNSNCTAGVGKLVKGTCSDTKLRGTCAVRCHSATAKKCLGKFKETQAQYMKRDKRNLDEHGIPMSPTAMKKAHDAASTHLTKTKTTVATNHAGHTALKAATAKERADFRNAAKARTKAAFQKQASVTEDDDSGIEEEDADGDSTAGVEDDTDAVQEEEAADEALVEEEEEEAAPAPAPVRRASVRVQAQPQVAPQPVYAAPAEDDFGL